MLDGNHERIDQNNMKTREESCYIVDGRIGYKLGFMLKEFFFFLHENYFKSFYSL